MVPEWAGFYCSGPALRLHVQKPSAVMCVNNTGTPSINRSTSSGWTISITRTNKSWLLYKDECINVSFYAIFHQLTAARHCNHWCTQLRLPAFFVLRMLWTLLDLCTIMKSYNSFLALLLQKIIIWCAENITSGSGFLRYELYVCVLYNYVFEIIVDHDQ